MIFGSWTWHTIPQFLCPVLTQPDYARAKAARGKNTLLLSIVWEIHITDLRYMLLGILILYALACGLMICWMFSVDLSALQRDADTNTIAVT